MKKDVKEKRHLPAPLRDAGVVTYIQPHLIPHLILRGGIGLVGLVGLVALARRTFPRRYQPQLLVPTRWFHEVSGARRRSVPKLRKLSVGLSASRVGGGALTRWPPSASQTVRADFRHTAFTKTPASGSPNRAKVLER